MRPRLATAVALVVAVATATVPVAAAAPATATAPPASAVTPSTATPAPTAPATPASPVAPSTSTTATPASSATDLSGPCDDTDNEALNIDAVLATITAFNTGSPAGDPVTLDRVLAVISAYNTDGDLPDDSVDSSIEVRVAGHGTPTNVTVRLRCTERAGDPVVYERTLTVGTNDSGVDSRRFVVDTGGQDGQYRLVVTTENDTAEHGAEPPVTYVVDDNTTYSAPGVGFVRYHGVSVTGDGNVSVDACTGDFHPPPHPCAPD